MIRSQFALLLLCVVTVVTAVRDTGGKQEHGQEIWKNRGKCSNNMCQNGGQCMDRCDYYTCRCPPEWTGRFCEDDVDECLLDPTVCKNGGTCVNFPGGHSCACVNGWSGVDCSENIDDCLSAVCASGSTCVDRVASFSCLCQPGRTGLLCHIDDACIRNPCGEGQECVTNRINGRAICYTPANSARVIPPVETEVLNSTLTDTGEEGKEVWINRGNCSDNLCQKGSQCLDRGDQYTCRCPPQWTGRFCEDDVDECLLDPTVCKNGGTCVNFPGGHSCACVNGWSGVDCSENIDDCLSAACASGSTCVDRVASFSCLCQPGRTGLLCHIDDACIRNPCGEGQECVTNPLNGRAICYTPANSARVIPPVETEVLNSTLTDTGEEGNEVWINRGNCSDNLCQKGSQCLDRGDQYTCRCPPQWTGRFCEDDVDECLLDPTVCKNGGTCVNFPGGHSCACVNGWSGVDCSENIDDCLSAACASGSTCVDRVASFFCLCQPGRTGLLCHLVDVCIRNPCAEGQHCETNPINGRAICYD